MTSGASSSSPTTATATRTRRRWVRLARAPGQKTREQAGTVSYGPSRRYRLCGAGPSPLSPGGGWIDAQLIDHARDAPRVAGDLLGHLPLVL
jgi:hypothetical protein